MTNEELLELIQIYESLIDYNVHSPADYPFGWQLIEE